MIVADTSAILALIDADDQHHESVRELFDSDPESWILPSAILPEVDYILGTHIGVRAQRAFMSDLARSNFSVEWGDEHDIARAHALCERHRDLRLGLVDATVAAVAERVGARAIATLDYRHFGALALNGSPALYPRDVR